MTTATPVVLFFGTIYAVSVGSITRDILAGFPLLNFICSVYLGNEMDPGIFRGQISISWAISASVKKFKKIKRYAFIV
jgi:hypothetical protein